MNPLQTNASKNKPNVVFLSSFTEIVADISIQNQRHVIEIVADISIQNQRHVIEIVADISIQNQRHVIEQKEQQNPH
jgi:hypothetical protein